MSISGRRKPAPDQRLKARPHSILVSVSGLIGRSVYDRRGNRVGRVHDLVVALGNGGDYPPLHGILVRTRRKVVFIPYAAMAGILRWEVYLTTSGLQPHPVPNQDGFVALAGDLLDRHLLAGAIRVSDLVLDCLIDEIRLVGADVSIRTLLRRAGSPWMRRTVATRRVYDWAAVGAIPEPIVRRATQHEQQEAVHGEHNRPPGPRLAWGNGTDHLTRSALSPAESPIRPASAAPVRHR